MTNQNDEWQRLAQLYAGLSDSQVLGLLQQKSELTEVAQQALAAEAASRDLREPEPEPQEEPEDFDGASAAEGFTQLCRFQMAADAEAALNALEDEGIACRVEQARARESAGGEPIVVPGLDLLVEAGREHDARNILRKRLKLFPLQEVESDGGDADQEPKYIAGSFATEEEAQAFAHALHEADLHAVCSHQAEDDGSFWAVEVAFDDLEPALAVAGRISQADEV